MGKKGGKRNINTLRRVRLVCAMVKEHYEPGVLKKCYKAVWREHVYPVYPMCYRTFLNYVSTSPALLRDAEAAERFKSSDQLSLF